MRALFIIALALIAGNLGITLYVRYEASIPAGISYAEVTATTKPRLAASEPRQQPKSKVTVLARTTIPIGHFEFCKKNPAECQAIAYVPAKKLTQFEMNQLNEVNRQVNADVKPLNDIDIYGKDEVWAYPNGKGDCEDYALEKRRRLMARGWPASLLLLTVARRLDGQGHAVLMVRTEMEDLILDNLTDAINPWNEAPYKFLKRQIPDHAGKWQSIRDTRADEARMVSGN